MAKRARSNTQLSSALLSVELDRVICQLGAGEVKTKARPAGQPASQPHTGHLELECSAKIIRVSGTSKYVHEATGAIVVNLLATIMKI